jgi:multiple sugar transport system substrate-binding protein
VIDSELTAAVNTVITGDKTAQEAMDELAAKIDTLLAE